MPCWGPGGGGPPPPFGDGGVCCTPLAETCDGADLGGASCESLGFAGGTLFCGGWCGFDTSDCDGCATDPRVTSCDWADVDSDSAYGLALASNDTEVGLAWITVSGPDPMTGMTHQRLHFARFRADDLAPIGETDCIGPEDPYFVSLTATPSGWLIAVATSAGAVLVPLDAAGEPRGATRFIASAGWPFFAGRPDGGPLLVYTEPPFAGTGGRPMGREVAELVDDDGTPLWETTAFDATSIEANFGTAVYTGDGFLVAQRHRGVTVARIEMDGRVSSTTMTSHDATEYPQISWTGSEARVSFADFSGEIGMFWARLDRNGVPLEPPRRIDGGATRYFDPAPTAADGNDMVILLGEYTGGTGLAARLDVARIGQAGSVTTTPFAVTQDPNGARSYRLARAGSRFVVAWVSGGYGPPGFGGLSGADYPGRIGIGLVAP